MKASEFDRRFDAGDDSTEAVDWEKAQRPNLAPFRVNVDFPTWVVEKLDREAQRLGITRQALIKVWVSDRLEGRDGKAA
ncbi:type II toxin-antitoxin system BrnA family antitoxin [Sinorhizobium meliloti]|uniref:type II toxin-antitoxin system BrnA family antitoxin n=1 Tax=Rhizobium meliloti TaxID=382 RepID=UPI000FDC4A64|nr:CopG family transcriptional regulator [Sinorhizobium meliloti]RVP95689.1 CopG family transcriptional regulator [Sinorhizobium meliloti]